MFRNTNLPEQAPNNIHPRRWFMLMAAASLALTACGDSKESKPLDTDPTTEITESTVGVVIDDPPPEEESPNVVDLQKVEEFHASSTTTTTSP